MRGDGGVGGGYGGCEALEVNTKYRHMGVKESLERAESLLG